MAKLSNYLEGQKYKALFKSIDSINTEGNITRISSTFYIWSPGRERNFMVVNTEFSDDATAQEINELFTDSVIDLGEKLGWPIDRKDILIMGNIV